MYIKFFGNKSGGSKGSVNYLLNEKRVNDGTAKVLKGNPEFTKAIIGEIKTKHKVTIGSINLSEGESLTQKQKEQVMLDFEKTLCPGLDENQYNILWVEHTDKGRLELNFVIPKIELTTQKAFNPYFHKLDFARIDMFEDIQNIKYNLQSKKDPANAQTLLGSKIQINLVKDYIALDKQLFELTLSGNIQSREHLIELIKESGCEITRINAKGMSIKLPDSKKAHRFRGSIYDEQFRSIQDFERISKDTEQRAKDFSNRDKSRELEQTISRLDRYNEQKAQLNREKYKLKDDKHKKTEQKPIQSKDFDNSNNLNNDRDKCRNNPSRNIDDGLHTKISKTHKMANTKKDEIQRREQEIYNEPKSTIQRRQDNSIHQDRRIDYDTRRRTLKRIRERAEAQQRAYEEARQSRVELHQAITEQSKELRAEFEQNSIKLSREYATDTDKSRELIRGAKEVAQESESSVRLSDELNRTTKAREQITNTVRNFIERVKEFGTSIKDKFQSVIQQSEETTRTARENINNKTIISSNETKELKNSTSFEQLRMTV